MQYSGMKVLVVEDDAMARLVVRTHLTTLGCEVDFAVNGAEAIQKANEKKFNLILMDIGLPDNNGFGVTELIRQGSGVNKDSYIVALTAHTEDAYRSQASLVRMNDFMDKPATLEKLERILAKAVEYEKTNSAKPPKPRL